jgi:hypothetical protein
MTAKHWPLIRDIVLFFGGLAIVLHEVFLSATERPTILLLAAAMMGLPAFLRADERHRDVQRTSKRHRDDQENGNGD